MTDIIPSISGGLVQPRVPINIRLATPADLPFMDALQKKHSKQLGYFPTKQFEGYIEMGGVLIAEEGLRTKDLGLSEEAGDASLSSTKSLVLSPQSSVPLGYCVSRDRYLKRDELGVIYQLCVVPGEQRKLVGAALVQAVFERAAYGCRLFCCWCAQDLAANRFWESLGFAPIAFRAGSDRKGMKDPSTGLRAGRVHIFWQKRIRRGDSTTPWWFPSKTESGALRADRIVLPIPRGMRWDDDLPRLLPAEEGLRTEDLGLSEEKQKIPRKAKSSTKSLVPSPKSSARTVQFGKPGAIMPTAAKPPAPPAEIVKAPRVKREKPKCDPKLVQVARELRDRWLEQVNEDPMMLVSTGKYEVSKTLSNVEGGKSLDVRPHPRSTVLTAGSPLPEGEGARQMLLAPRLRSGQAA